MDESVEEDRRAAALCRAAGHPLRSKRLQLRHEKEREEKRTLINWIRKDIEVIYLLCECYVTCVCVVLLFLLQAAVMFSEPLALRYNSRRFLPWSDGGPKIDTDY